MRRASKKIFLPLLLVGLIMGISDVIGGELSFTLNFSRADLHFEQVQGYDRVTIADYMGIGGVGKPDLSEGCQYVLIPPSAQVIGIEVVSFKREELPGKYFISPAQPPSFLSSAKTGTMITPDPQVYASSKPYPEELVVHANTGSKGGYRLAGLLIRPLQYIPAQHKLILYSEIKFKLMYEENRYEPLRRTIKQNEIFSRMVKRMVLNPEDTDRWAPPLSPNPLADIKYVIITPEALAIKFEPLRQLRQEDGYTVEIVYLQSILEGQGYDPAEKIRNFIKTKNEEGGLYFLLGGDADDPGEGSGVVTVPRRDVWFRSAYDIPELPHTLPNEEWIPCDLYFADLDGTWDDEQEPDHVYGELEDNPDMYADVFVGRALVDDAAEVEHFVNRIIIFENNQKNPPQDYLKKLLLPSQKFLGESGYLIN